MEPTQQTPLAIWNTARDAWERPQTEGLFCEHLDVYSETFPTSGTMRNGVAYELPTWEPHTAASESSSLLPTVTTQDGKNNGGPSQFERNTPPLNTRVLMLQTPTAAMAGGVQTLEVQVGGRQKYKTLPTPTTTATDAKGSRNLTASRQPGAVFNSGVTLTDAVTLLPSPRASEGEKGGPNMRGSKGDLMLSSAVTNLPRGTGSYERKPSADSKTPKCGASTDQPSDDGSKLWEDVPLPLPNPRDATEATD